MYDITWCCVRWFMQMIVNILYLSSWRAKTTDGELLFGLLHVKVLVVLCTV